MGCVAICHKKRVGVITHSRRQKTSGVIVWYGIGFDGKPWQSKDPAWMADNVREVLDNLRKHKGMQ